MFSTNLKKLRSTKRISQTELGKELGVTQGTVGRWETNRRIPDSEMLKRIAVFFDTTVDELLDNEPNSGLIVLSRRIPGISESDRQEIVEKFEKTIDAYLESKMKGKK